MDEHAEHDSKVVKFYAADAMEDPDNVLELSKGIYSHVLVLGWRDDDGEMDASASANLKDGGDILWLIEHLKLKLLTGAFLPDEFHD